MKQSDQKELDKLRQDRKDIDQTIADFERIEDQQAEQADERGKDRKDQEKT